MWTRLVVALVVVLLLAGTGFLVLAWEPAMGLSPAPDPASFEPELKQRGAELAKIGNCNTCHAGRDKAFAGGRPIPTPFGTIYATNITPDPDTGIGRWSEAAFARAMREGVDQQGRHLYPAFPYDHFTKLTDDDVKALYAFVMTREGVRAQTPANELTFPLNIRLSVAAWKLLFFRKGRFNPDPAHDEAWNRGAYLADAVGHCGACHTPRNRLGAERKGDAFAGGEAEGWHAPALNSASPSPVPWTEEALHTYLRRGIAEQHALTAGPMADVIRSLSRAPEQDIGAIARYIASLDTRTAEQKSASAAVGKTLPETASGDTPVARGARIYAGACAECHDRGREAEGGAMRLELATGLTMPTPRNLIHIIREGIIPPDGESGGWMPGYAGALTDEQLTDLVTYLRSAAGRPPWPEVAAEVRRSSRE
jgi:mono/diheme cytochrome c family protein